MLTILVSLLVVLVQIILKKYAHKHLVPKKINITKITRSNDSWISMI